MDSDLYRDDLRWYSEMEMTSGGLIESCCVPDLTVCFH